MRIYTKSVPPERLYWSERNRRGRRRLLRIGRWQLWVDTYRKPSV